jgi:hypothetical protein
MLTTILLVLFYLLFRLSSYDMQTLAPGGKIGTIVIAYAIGLAIGNIRQSSEKEALSTKDPVGRSSIPQAEMEVCLQKAGSLMTI